MDRISRIKLTQQAVDVAIADHQPGRRQRHWFHEIGGLYLQITHNGCASYCLRFERPSGGKGDYTIGKVSRVTPLMVREAAKKKLADLTLNQTDPCIARRSARMLARQRKVRTFGSLAESFMAAAENQQLADRTQRDRRIILDKYLLPRLKDRPLDSITRAHMKECLRDILASTLVYREKAEGDVSAGNRTANKAHEVVRRIFNWGIDEERCDANPAAFPKMFDDQSEKRSGVLDDERVRVLWEAFNEEANKGWGEVSLIAIRACIVTLQRPNEVVRARKEQFDWQNGIWTIPAAITKTNVEYTVPLSPLAVEVFREAFLHSDSPWAFPAKDRQQHLSANVLTHRFGKTRRRLVIAGALPTKDIELYDFRRLGRTLLEERLGVSEHIAERVINHAPDRRIGRRYNVGSDLPNIRRAQEAWSQELSRIVCGTQHPDNVVRISQPSFGISSLSLSPSAPAGCV